jgi:hypothetical protein
VTFFADPRGHILGNDPDFCPSYGRRKAPRHSHLARKSRVVGLKRDELDHALIRNQLGKPPLDDIRVFRGLARVRMIASSSK